jgi:hypothetical protein
MQGTGVAITGVLCVIYGFPPIQFRELGLLGTEMHAA